MRTYKLAARIACAGAAVVLAFSGCGKKQPATAVEPTVTPAKPAEAATQIEQAFTAAAPEVQGVADVASKALRTADYEAAVQSLMIIKQKGELTPDQGMAVHNSMISLEARLIAAAAAGDQNAQRAYDQLKKARRR